MSSRSVPFLLCGVLLSSGFLLPANVSAEVTYAIKAKTYDKIQATVFVPQIGPRIRTARQGSFGAPSLNDRGSVGYACILAGRGISSFTNNSVVVRLPGENHVPIVAVQAGNIVSDSFLPGVQGAPFAVPSTGKMYRIGRDVAINNNNRIGFTGELLFSQNSGADENPTFSDQSTASYGLAVPRTKRALAFRTWGLNSFVDYYEGILMEPISLNLSNSTVYDANFYVTSDKTVPGVAFQSQHNGAIIATTDATVIGLPYFTTFQSFSEPVIANNNVAFLVADISDEGDAFDGIWQGNNPNLQPIVVKDTEAPSGGMFASFAGVVGPSNDGSRCSFIATLTDTDTAGAVFRVNTDGSECTRIAYIGQKAPGNEYIGNLGGFATFDRAATSNNGRVAFQATAPGVKGNIRSGIWVTDRNGENLSLVVREGQVIPVKNKNNKTFDKTVIKITFNPISGLNRKGQVAFTASFSDRTSAVIIAQVKGLE